jgi:RND superfamily putative drug exporter
MALLGEWNWYLPRWLQWLPRISHEPAPQAAGSAPFPSGPERREIEQAEGRG